MHTRPSTHRYADADPPRSQTAKVMGEIGLGIVSGAYPQNSLLPGDAELMERFKVSRTVLREAMKTLAGKGLVQPKARIGTRVRDRSKWNLFDPDVLIWHARSGFDRAFFDHLSEVRLALEPEAAALAAERRTPAQVRQLFERVAEMGAPGVSPEAFVEADFQFHLTVAEASGNPFLRSISTLIEVVLIALLATASPFDNPKRLERSVARHGAIAKAIERQDGEAARAAMKLVISEAVDASRRAGPR